MNLFGIINLAIVAVNLPMAGLLFKEARGRQPNILLGFLCLAAVIWGAGSFQYSSAHTKASALFWWQIANVGSILSTVLFYHFILSFLNIRRTVLTFTVNALAAFYLFLNFFHAPAFIGDLRYVFGQFYYISWPGDRLSPYLIYYAAFYFLLLFYSFYLLSKAFTSATGQRRQQIKYLFAGMAIGFIGCHACFLPVFHIDIYPALSILIAFYIVPISYAIIKYKLMDINIIIKKSVVYTVLITIITVLCLISVYFTEHIVQSVMGYKSLLISTISATLIALAFMPLRNFIQDMVERTLFHGSYIQVSEENEQLRQEVIHTEKFKAIATLASGLAHEIRNPLTAIQTFNEHLARKTDDPEFISQYQRTVGRETARINNLLQELLTFAKPNPPRMATVHVDQLIRETLILIEPKCTERHIRIDYTSPESCTIQADAGQLKQALLNILMNAVDAMPAGGTLTIQAGTNKRNATITISDTGCGITPKDLPHIFEPFYSQKEKGTGLGLSITQNIVEQHGGMIKVESKPDAGTTFRIICPIS